MKFADIPGHEDVKDRLRHMADSGRIPHALLLEGPEGTGKFALAQAFAQYIHCTDRHDGDSCGRCPACLQHQTYNHIDTVYSFPIVKRKSSGVTVCNDWFKEFTEFMSELPYMDIKEWVVKLDKENAQPVIYVDEANELTRRLTFMTRRSQFKTALLWLPERLQEQAANKLLKVIEEPFADTIFIMTSDQPRRILPTIYSRTQRIEVPPYTEQEVVAILTANGIEPAQAAEVSRAAEGNINRAIRLCGSSDVQRLFFVLFTTMMRAAYGRRVGELRKWSLDVAALGREKQLLFIEYMARMIRESFITHLADDRLLTASPSEQSFLQKFYPYINHKNVEDFIKLLDTAARDIASNGNAKMIFFDLAVRAIILIRR